MATLMITVQLVLSKIVQAFYISLLYFTKVKNTYLRSHIAQNTDAHSVIIEDAIFTATCCSWIDVSAIAQYFVLFQFHFPFYPVNFTIYDLSLK